MRVVSVAALLGIVLLARVGGASSPIAVAPDGGVWVVNPDSDTVARIDPATNTREGEFPIGDYPRTLAVGETHVYVTSQGADRITRLGFDGAPAGTADLGAGCGPYGVAVSAAGDRVFVTCQSTSALHVLDAALNPMATIPLDWPEARALAIAGDGKIYVTHFITKEPNHDGHVSEIDPASGTVTRVFAIPPDFATCETRASGQGVANLLSAIAVLPGSGGAPDQLWVGGTLHNVLRKGLFSRSRFFQDESEAALFPDLDFQSNPAGEGERARRNIYKAGFHDLARSVIWKFDLSTGAVTTRLDVASGGQVAGLSFSPDGGIAYAVDLLANGFYAFRTGRGDGTNAGSIFGDGSAFGPGGADATAPCTGDPGAIAPESGHILPPQARLVPTGGMNPLDAVTLAPVDTGLDFTVATGLMRGVPDGVGTTPTGVALSSDGTTAYVANYLARNVVVLDATQAGFRCQRTPSTACASRLDCAPNDECMPLVRAVVPSTGSDPLPPQILDGKIAFTTAARDAAGANGPVPPWNHLTTDGTVNQGEVISTARDGGSLSCNSCHPDFGGQDGRTWDFAQFGSSFRNTMDLRGRAAFAPGTCETDDSVACTTDAECGPFLSGARCLNDPAFIPPNIPAPYRTRFFNPMGSIHWNGDRDEVEDFEFTFRELLGASDCDGNEDKPETCVGGLVIRRFTTDPEPIDLAADLSPVPNRTLTARLDHLGDYVYSLTAFPRNPHLGPDGDTPSAEAETGRDVFNDAVVNCAFCHNGPAAGRQQFTNKGPNPGYDPTQTPRADLNSPFLRFPVGTANVFDKTNPFDIANDRDELLGFTLFQNEQTQVPGNRTALDAYVTPPLNDVWNTAPYLHDGSAATLLDVVRPCSQAIDDCFVRGRGRNVDDLHGATSFLSARQLNALVAFQLAPHGPIADLPNLSNLALTVTKLTLHVGKQAGADALTLQAKAALPMGTALDPVGDPVTLSVGVPAGGRMAIVERVLPSGSFTGRGSTFRFADRRGEVADGLRSVSIKVRGGQVAVKTVLRKADLAPLHGRDPDLTIALEIGTRTLASTRHYVTNAKGTTTRLPSKRKRR
jgi:DNA-binding beta-propeller fold protein YncE